LDRHIEVKCACPHKKEYVRTDDDDDPIQKFLTEFDLYDSEINNRGKQWSKSEAKHLEELWFTNLKIYTKPQIKNALAKRFGRSEEEISSQLNPMEYSNTKYPLYHMSSIENLQSILSTGILSHDLSMEKNPKRISDVEIVDDRKKIKLSSGLSLTHYANFYFIPKNAMLWKRLFVCQYCEKKIQDHNPGKLTECNAIIQSMYGSRIIPENIIVFEINLDFNQEGVFVSDGNCAIVAITRTEPMPAHDIFPSIDEMKTKSHWTEKLDHKRRFQAECLIPQKVGVSSIRTINVQNDVIQEKIHDIIREKFPNLSNIEVKINSPMFFS